MTSSLSRQERKLLREQNWSLLSQENRIQRFPLNTTTLGQKSGHIKRVVVVKLQLLIHNYDKGVVVLTVVVSSRDHCGVESYTLMMGQFWKQGSLSFFFIKTRLERLVKLFVKPDSHIFNHCKKRQCKYWWCRLMTISLSVRENVCIVSQLCECKRFLYRWM